MKYYCDGSRFRPDYRGVPHLIMLTWTPLWLLAQLSVASTVEAVISVLLSVSAVWVCLGSSVVFHVFPLEKPFEDLFARLDLFGIMYMITFKMSPVLMILIPEVGYPIILFMMPILMYYFRRVMTLTNYDSKHVQVGCFIVIGSIVIVTAVPMFVCRATAFEIGCWAGGFVFNTIGGCAYIYQWPDPNPKKFGYHEIFHSFHVCATILSCMTNYSVLYRHGQRLAGL